MTDTEAILLRAVLESPGDDTPRLAYADWLDDNTGIMRCPECQKKPDEMNHPPGMMFVGWGHGWQPCMTCGGSATVPDGRRERAEFIRDCVVTLASHTDCPARLADLKQGRPVPLRCGECNYCVARRRAEKYYSRHPWIKSLPYAVAFEPTPLDGDMPTGPGLTLIVRRGFVAAVRAPLAVLVGGECNECYSHPSWGDFTSPNLDCPACSGTGRVPGIGRELFERQPVTRVEVTDRNPWHSNAFPNDWSWWEPPTQAGGSDGCIDQNLFQVIWDNYPEAWNLPLNTGERWLEFPTESAARDALSAAIVAHFREQCGLPPLG